MMAKRSAEEICGSINPLKSEKRYTEMWTKFYNFSELESSIEPTEENFLQFFDFLRNEEKKSYSTIWSTYSMLNYKFKAIFGKKLQVYPRLTILLKSYENGYKRKTASVFSKEQIDNFIVNALDEGENVHIKAALIVSFSGGLRSADLVGLETEHLQFEETTGFWVTYKVSKQKQIINNKFNVPLQYTKYLQNYLNKLENCGSKNGRLLKSMRKKLDGSTYYTNQNMGINQIQKFSLKIANFLKLPDAHSFTSHSFKRSSATAVAEAGASTSMMKSHFNWQNESTAIKYIENTKKQKLAVSAMIKPTENIPSGLADLNFSDLLDCAIEIPEIETRVEKPGRTNEKVIHLHNCSNFVVNM